MLKLKENKKLAEQHFSDVKDEIQGRINVLITANKIRVDNTTIDLTPHVVNLISAYLNDNTLKDLIVLSPESLNAKAEELHLHNTDYIDNSQLIFKLFSRIFVDYGYNKIKKENFINNIGIHTCPYCNRNYIYVLDRAGKIKPELDHFYPSGIYPLLAVSYYNLIPSCQTCNGNGGKYTSDPYITKITSPYLLRATDFEFKHNLISLSRVHPISGKSSVEVKFQAFLQPHFDTFKLDKLYEKHADHVLELIVKSRLKYSPKYRSYLKSYRGLVISDAEIDRLILGNYSTENELHKRPLSKLYKDIGKKLGLI